MPASKTTPVCHLRLSDVKSLPPMMTPELSSGSRMSVEDRVMLVERLAGSDSIRSPLASHDRPHTLALNEEEGQARPDLNRMINWTKDGSTAVAELADMAA